MQPSTPLGRLEARWPMAGFYACYFAGIGVWIPFWPLYLTHLGFGAQTIGLLMALTQWMRIPAPPFWGKMADRGTRHTVMMATSFATFGTFCLFFFGTGLNWVIVVTILFALFHAGPLALLDATTMEICVKREWDYGRIRLWGSWGFILFSLGIGPLTDWAGMGLIPMVIALLLLAGALFTLWLPRLASTHPTDLPTSGLFTRIDVRWFYLSALLMQFSHGAYYGFMSLHLQQHGFSRSLIGLLWAVGVLAEVVLMSHSKALLARFGVAKILTFSLLIAALRWSLYAMTLQLPVLLIAQLMHAFTFAAFYIACIRRVYESAPINLQGAAQGWLAALSFGLGGGLGLALSGLLFDRVGYELLFLIMALAALAGMVASHRAGVLWQRYEYAHV